MSADLTYNEETGRYEMPFDGALVFARVQHAGDTLTIDHVEAAPELRGKSAAGAFMKALMDRARTKNLKVIPLCGYAARWIEKHGEYHDLRA